ncbi:MULTISPECIES: hypothetical protein [unclassified Novosphingobium]|uniref:hypothetical protein n=1 Tax=unclassified Novosphingobium TaxID=2644732 RepID=UPI0025E7BCA9|nr:MULTISPECIES: hypothetical protein [unclassified Novosphingobium]HQS70160.1 hypothetical protein [Novosphingobium sp.]
MRLLIPALSIALATSGCGSNTAEQTIENRETGEKVTVSTSVDGGGIALPDNLPAFAAVYPGAKIITVASKPGATAEGLLAYSVKAQPQAVIDHYRKQGATAGMAVVTEMATGEARMLAMGKGEASSPAMQITTSPSGEDDGSLQVTVTYSAPAS